MNVMNSPVIKLPFKEVGWGTVEIEMTILEDCPEQLTVLHWHEENFDIPIVADLLFSNAYVNN